MDKVVLVDFYKELGLQVERFCEKPLRSVRRPGLLDVVEKTERAVIGEVEMQGCDRNQPGVYRGEIGTGFVIEFQVVAPDPVVLSATRIRLLNNGVTVTAAALPRHHEALTLTIFRHVHIQQCIIRQA